MLRCYLDWLLGLGFEDVAWFGVLLASPLDVKKGKAGLGGDGGDTNICVHN